MSKELKFILLWLFYSNVFFRYIYVNPIINLGFDILVFYYAIYKKALNRKTLTQLFGRQCIILVSLFFISTTISAFIHTIPLSSYLWGFKMFFRYFAIASLVYKEWGEKSIYEFKKLLYQAIYINFVCIVIQFFKRQTSDAMGGIMSGSGDLMLFICIATIVTTYDWVNKNLNKYKYLLMVVANYVAIMWAEVKLMYFFMPILIVATYTFANRLKKRSFILAGIVIALFTFALPAILSNYYDDDYVYKATNIEELSAYNQNQYGFTKLSFNRGTCVEMTPEIILQTPFEKWLGYGLGSGSASQLFKTWIFDKYGTTTFYFYFSLSYVMVEGGWIGIILFIAIYVFIFFNYLQIYMSTNDKKIRYWSVIGLLLGFVSLVLIYYNALPYSGFYIPFFVWGVCKAAIHERQIEIQQ